MHASRQTQNSFPGSKNSFFFFEKHAPAPFISHTDCPRKKFRISKTLLERYSVLLSYDLIERFSFECRKTKTKVITLANHIGHRQYTEPIKTRSNYMWLTQSAGKSCERVTIGFGFTSDWMKRWRESFMPIASCRKCKTNYFSTLK